MVRVLGIAGSPRRGGNTDLLLEEFMKGAASQGAETKTIELRRMKFETCRHCDGCLKTGQCVIKDDMETIRPIIADADLFIISTPVYVDGMTGPLKTFLDRLIPMIMGRVELRDGHMRHLVREGVKRGQLMLVSVSGFAELDNFDPLVIHVKAASKNLGRDYVGEILVPSGWFISYSSDALEGASNIISSAATSMVNDGKVPSEVSEQLSALVSIDEVMNAMNSYYNQFE